MMLAAAVVACGLHFPCDVPTQVDKPRKPAAHVSKSHEPVKHPAPPPDVVVKVPQVAPEDFNPAPTVHQTFESRQASAQKKGKTMLQSLESVYSWVSGLSPWVLICALVALYFGANKGVPWLKTKFSSFSNLLTADVKADIATLKDQFDALEAVVKASTPAAPVVAPIPATPVA